jgi:hypothetical protein
MVRFSVSLDEEQNEWVEQWADELNGSKSQVVGMAIDAARRNDVQLGTHLEQGDRGDSEDIRSRFETLEARVEELEAAINSAPGTESTTPQNRASSETDPTEAPATSTGETDEQTEVVESASPNGQVSKQRNDPEVNAVRTFIEREANHRASKDEITECWEFLKQRGTASPKAFKNRFAPESCTTEDDVDTWWQDGVKPVFQQLPGVETPDDGGRFYRYKY